MATPVQAFEFRKIIIATATVLPIATSKVFLEAAQVARLRFQLFGNTSIATVIAGAEHGGAQNQPRAVAYPG